MCLIVLALDAHPEFPLIVAGNRDEFFARPTQPAEFWPDQPHLLAGRDLEQGGTWLGVTKAGRFAAITNFRDGRRARGTGARSRGLLVCDFLLSSEPPARFLARLEDSGERYEGFNLLFGAGGEFYYFSNRCVHGHRLRPGVYGLSNHLLDTPWPKVERAKAGLRQALALQREAVADRLEALLGDDTQAPEEGLPQTGVPIEWERLLSSVFIRSPGYGTRASTTVLVSTDGGVQFAERCFGPDGRDIGRRDYRLSASR